MPRYDTLTQQAKRSRSHCARRWQVSVTQRCGRIVLSRQHLTEVHSPLEACPLAQLDRRTVGGHKRRGKLLVPGTAILGQVGSGSPQAHFLTDCELLYSWSNGNHDRGCLR